MITVTIDGYNNKKTTYVMPDNGTVNTWTVHTFKNGDNMYLSNVTIELMHPNGVEVKEEQNEQANQKEISETKK